MAGYHKRNITKGVVGEASKIMEEAEEFMDAVENGNPIMALVELSDLHLAIERYLEKKHPTLNMEDVWAMAFATKQAFDSGGRK